MKKILLIILTAVLGVFVCLWLLSPRQPAPLKPEAEAPPAKRYSDRASQNISHNYSEQSPMASNGGEEIERWLSNHSAGLVISQTTDPLGYEHKGTVTTAEGQVIDLGETPPLYRHQLRTSGYPVMLGERNERRYCYIYVVNPLSKTYLLSVTYPRWAQDGIQTSGAFVFMRNENPVTRIGVIIPEVKVPKDLGPGAAERTEWQILIGGNYSSEVDVRTAAKPQPLGSDVVVLMPTDPAKIPESSLVVWFKFKKDGTVALLED